MKYTERIYSESEMKLIKEIFDMTIQQLYDEDLKELIKDCKEMFVNSQELLKEIERVNNIIRDLEVELYAKYHEYKDSECEELYAKSQEDKAIYDYIQELKGSDK